MGKQTMASRGDCRAFALVAHTETPETLHDTRALLAATVLNTYVEPPREQTNDLFAIRQWYDELTSVMMQKHIRMPAVTKKLVADTKKILSAAPLNFDVRPMRPTEARAARGTVRALSASELLARLSAQVKELQRESLAGLRED